jgi:2-(1,2-epoxy-1,2-dihydrophenyl)acetyl-CoA isomerase
MASAFVESVADSEVLRWRDGSVAHIRFNRPAALNAVNEALATKFHDACEELSADPEVRVVVLSGAGSAFMAGGDLPSMNGNGPAVAARLIESMHASVRILADLPCPVIASVQGAVAGGGLGLALACDLCIAAEGTRFSMAYPLIGTSSDCGTSWALPRLVGVRKALEIAWLSKPLLPEEAQRLGLVNRIVPAEGLEEATRKLSQELARGPALALRHIKTLVRAAGARSLDSHLDAERATFLECAATADFAEGVAAFLQKRPAQFCVP